MPVNMSSLLLLDEKGKIIDLGRRSELFCSAQKNYEKNTCGITVKNYLQKMGHKFAAFQDANIKPLFTV
jgi:hypothetical protein